MVTAMARISIISMGQFLCPHPRPIRAVHTPFVLRTPGYFGAKSALFAAQLFEPGIKRTCKAVSAKIFHEIWCGPFRRRIINDEIVESRLDLRRGFCLDPSPCLRDTF